jgi:hypothetical protein
VPRPELVLVALPGAEIVWGERTAGDRAVIRSIPEPSSGFHWLDEVRVIPTPIIDLTIDDVDYPVLPAPEVLEGSGIPTVIAHVACADVLDLTALVDEFDAQGWRCEDWTADVRVVCSSCMSAASEDPAHRHEGERWFERHGVAIAGRSSDAETTLRLWIDEAPERRALVDIDEIE